MYSAGVPYQWQYTATRASSVPDAVLRAAAGVKLAVVDTGADVTAPDLAAKKPETYNVLNEGADVRDFHGHGTFVASIAGGSVGNGEGIAGFGGDAQLLLVQSGRADGSFTDVDEAEAIVYAVNHGAKIINLSIGGTQTSAVEKKALDYAAEHGVLVVAAAGNEFAEGNPIEYPAALLQRWARRGAAASASRWGNDEGRQPRGVLEHRLLDLPRCPGRERPRAVSGESKAGLGRDIGFRARRAGCTGSRAGRPSRRPRSLAPQRSSGLPIRLSAAIRSPGSSADGLRRRRVTGASATASSTSAAGGDCAERRRDRPAGARLLVASCRTEALAEDARPDPRQAPVAPVGDLACRSPSLASAAPERQVAPDRTGTDEGRRASGPEDAPPPWALRAAGQVRRRAGADCDGVRTDPPAR